MKIDELPTEVLIKIFGYLLSYIDVALVNRRFYDIVCSVHYSVSFSSIFEKNGNHRSVMDSIQNTRRKISKLTIDLGDHPDLVLESAISDAVAIVKKFSSSIKHFELRQALMEMPHFLEMLSWLPNAEHLMFYEVYEQQSPTDCQLSNECLNLHHLKTLECRVCSPEFLVAFNRLPAGVLRKLNISHYWNLNLDLLTDLLLHQWNIKELVIKVDFGTLPDHIFDHLKLESLELDLSEYSSSHAMILAKQTKLIHLRLPGGEADDQILKVVTNQLSELETVQIRVDEAQVVPFKRIEKLKKLKDLTLNADSLKVIETLAGLDNSRITTLDMKEMHMRDVMSVDVIAALANSLRNLKVLRFGYNCECQIIDAVMEHFNFLEVLEIRLDYRIDANVFSQAIEVGRCYNPKLTELRITADCPCDESLLTKLAAVYPNLKKLYFRSSPGISITVSFFKALLNGFKQMEALNLEVCDLYTGFVECIMEHKNHLKFITLGRFDSEYEFTADHKSKLSAVFDVTKYHNRALHLAK